MKDLALVIGGLFVGVLVLYVIANFLQKKTDASGNLFTGTPTPTMRGIAFIFGLLFGGIFLLEIFTSDRFLIVMPVLSIALIAYSLGAYQIINTIQTMWERDRDDRDSD